MDRSTSFKARKKNPDADGVIAQQVADRIVNNSTNEINDLLRSLAPPPQPVVAAPPPPPLVPDMGMGMMGGMPPMDMGMGMPMGMPAGMPAMPPLTPVQSQPAVDPQMIELMRYLGLI